MPTPFVPAPRIPSRQRSPLLLVLACAGALAATLSACASSQAGAAATSTASTPVADSTATWPGVYLGNTPCADCEGVQTSLLLRPNATYQFATKHLGAKGEAGELQVQHGRVSFNRARTELTLDSLAGASGRYLIGEGQLVQLDSTGNQVVGEQAARYVLKKQISAKP